MIQKLTYSIELAAIFICVALLLRSFFFIWTARKKMPVFNFYFFSSIIVGGMFHLLYSYDYIINAVTFPVLIYFYCGSSIAIYFVSKIERDSVYTVSNITNQLVSEVERSVVKQFKNSTKLEVINYAKLTLLKIGEKHVIDGIFIIRQIIPFDLLFFKTIFPPGVEMSRQKHHDCVEWCYIIEGEMIDRETGIVYNKGNLLKLMPDEIHKPCNNLTDRKLILDVYFQKIELYENDNTCGDAAVRRECLCAK